MIFYSNANFWLQCIRCEYIKCVSMNNQECKVRSEVGINGYIWDDLDQNFQIFNHQKPLNTTKITTPQKIPFFNIFTKYY